MWNKLSIEAVSESSILVRFSDEIDVDLPPLINAVAEAILSEHAHSIMNITPAFTTLLIDYLPYRISEHEFLHDITAILHAFEVELPEATFNTTELPVFYDESVAPDLPRIMEDKGLSKNELIKMHSSQAYTVCAMGFAPGFAFLASVPDRLSTPRLSTPRLSVKKGSLGIAEQQTAIYPSQTPGGWNIIGNCPVILFDASSEQLSPFRVGDKVIFTPIEKDEFLALGGELWD